MHPVRDFRDLIVWQRSVDFIVSVYELSGRFPRSEQFGLTRQLREAALSISSNIAEGSARSTKKDRRHFYGIARASLKEAESLLLVAQRLSFTSEEDCSLAFSLSDETSRMLTTLRRKLNT